MNLTPKLILLSVLSCFIHVGDGACPRVTLKNGRSRLRNRARMVHFRCNRGYTRVGQKFAVCLKTGHWSQQTPLCVIGRGCPKLPSDPMIVTQKLYRGGVVKFTCTPGLKRVGPEQISCDGTSWSDPPPKCLDGISLGCDFEEEGNCGWSHDSSAKFEWTRNSGETPTDNTGPKVDHTTNSTQGHYLFIESSSPMKSGDNARLLSPSYSPSDVVGVCLEFFYHMYGPSDPGAVGSLDVFVRPESMPTSALGSTESVFHRHGNQGDSWRKSDVEIPEQKEFFQLVFQAKRMYGWFSDIAIDDIRLFNCSERVTTQVMLTSSGEVTTAETMYDFTSSPEGESTSMTASSTPSDDQTPRTSRQTTTTRATPSSKTTTTSTTRARSRSTTRTTTLRTRRTPKPRTTTTPPITTTPRRTTTRRTTTSTTPTTTTARRTTTRRTTTLTTPSTTTPRRTTTRRTTATSSPMITTPRRTTTRRTKASTTSTTAQTATPPPTTTTTTVTAPSPNTTSSIMTTKTTKSMRQTVPTMKSTTSTKHTSTTTTTTRTSATSTPRLSDVTSRTPTMSERSSGSARIQGSTAMTSSDQRSRITSTLSPKASSTRLDSSSDSAMDSGTHDGTTDEITQPTSDASPGPSVGSHQVAGDSANTGEVKESGGESSGGMGKLLPLIVGVVGAVVVGAVVIALLAWMWAKNQRRKREKEEEDQMNIITEYVDTNLNN